MTSHLKQGDKPEVMLKAVIEKAVKNGWKPDGYTITLPYLPDSVYETLFDHSFAKAYGYKLRDLGDWCDKGGDALEFVYRLL